jgi:hypothetical protein
MSHLTDIFADCEYLYLDRLFEPAENRLSVRILEATSGGQIPSAILDSESFKPVKDVLNQATAIEHREGCRIFELTWPTYVGYSVLNESFALPEPETSTHVGRLFVEYTSSTYLDYLKRASWACADFPGPYRHWAALCLNHIVDVASVDDPAVEVSIANASENIGRGSFEIPIQRR